MQALISRLPDREFRRQSPAMGSDGTVAVIDAVWLSSTHTSVIFKAINGFADRRLLLSAVTRYVKRGGGVFSETPSIR